jgi:hypothetical protein
LGRTGNFWVLFRFRRIRGARDAFSIRCRKAKQAKMTEMRIEVPDDLAKAIEQRASELGTTPDQLLSEAMIDVAGLPDLETDSDLLYR